MMVPRRWIVVQVRDVAGWLEGFAPLALAESWDNVGLLLGDPEAAVGRMMTCLTITPIVIAEALREQVGMIVSHHPILFKPTQQVTTVTSEGRMVWDLCRAGVAVYSPHTAYDNCRGGINDQLASHLSLRNVRPLVGKNKTGQVKIVVFVPDPDLAAVSQALFDAGAGVIGLYRECSFRSPGIGSFFGTTDTQPTVGQRGQREHIAEQRLEVVCPLEQLTTALNAMRKAHSYEEPAFDVYPLYALPDDLGVGRVGELPEAVSAKVLAQRLMERLGSRSLTVTGARNRSEIRTVAIICGAGGSLLAEAMKKRVDAFVTGELRFHDELTAQQAGITALVAGHYATERPGMEELASLLAKAFPGLPVWASGAEADPAAPVLQSSA